MCRMYVGARLTLEGLSNFKTSLVTYFFGKKRKRKRKYCYKPQNYN